MAISLTLGVVASELAAGDAPRFDERFYVAGRTEAKQGCIACYAFASATGEIAELPRWTGVEKPNFLAFSADGSRLYSVGQDGPKDGVLVTFAVEADGRLRELARQATPDGVPCHLALSASGTVLVVVNWLGSVASYTIGADGIPTPPRSTIRHSGSGPRPSQEIPHPHGVALSPPRPTAPGGFALIADAGIDRVMVYAVDERAGTLTPHPAGNLATAPGAGPRQLWFSADHRRIYAVGEIDAAIWAWTWDADQGTGAPLATVPGLPKDWERDALQMRGERYAFPPTSMEPWQGFNRSAQVMLSADGRFLYSSNRGHDSIALFSVAADGRPDPIGHVNCRGQNPWHFTISPNGAWMLVANEGTHSLVQFRRDPVTGRLQRAVWDALAIERPMCVVFAPPRR